MPETVSKPAARRPAAPAAVASADAGDDAHPLLRRIGAALRARRLAQRVTADEAARRAGLSRRFITMVESGRGNISLVNLARLCAALGAALPEVVAESSDRTAATRVVALLGLRGAGKSSLGPKAAKECGARFVELDALVEERAGMRLAEIFATHGEEFFRRLEHAVLLALVDGGERLVVATGGGIVTSAESLALLRTRCATVWLKATPDHHWSRVADQGDRRPFEVRTDARAALRALLRRRAPLYAGSDHVVDTSRLGPAGAQKRLTEIVRRAFEDRSAD
jgi:XRE family aerobic/anaerobic benzoate catabolism transcriptional regulator